LNYIQPTIIGINGVIMKNETVVIIETNALEYIKNDPYFGLKLADAIHMAYRLHENVNVKTYHEGVLYHAATILIEE
jgi:hypothetical protein